MAVKGVRFGVTGQTIQVGSMTGAVTSDAAVAVSGIIEIVDTSGSGAYIAFGSSSGVSAPSDEAAGAIFVPPFGTTRPFLVPDGMTHLHATNKVNVRSLNNA
tara:strand:- start:1013 stop:1318 length:306 start_codon:yes stop_codon:yes gene_type:complete